jgi:hypothetical protein
MDRVYQRRTQKGMGRTEKITQGGATKNPRLLKACNTIPVRTDMGEFFFISIKNEMTDFFICTKKQLFYKEWVIFWLKNGGK